MSILSLFKPLVAIAANTPQAMTNVRTLTDKFGGELYGGTQKNFFEVLGGLINVLLSLLGVILLAFIVVAGFYWITAGGNSSQVEKAKTLIQNAIIGLVIILVSISLSSFIQARISSAVNPDAPVTGSTGGAGTPTNLRDCTNVAC